MSGSIGLGHSFVNGQGPATLLRISRGAEDSETSLNIILYDIHTALRSKPPALSECASICLGRSVSVCLGLSVSGSTGASTEDVNNAGSLRLHNRHRQCLAPKSSGQAYTRCQYRYNHSTLEQKCTPEHNLATLAVYANRTQRRNFGAGGFVRGSRRKPQAQAVSECF